MLKKIWAFWSQVFEEWNEDNCFRLSAALSYYTLFSIAPLVIIIIATAGYFFGEDAISGIVFGKVNALIGNSGAAGLQSMVKNAYIGRPTSLSGLVSVATLIFSATVVMTSVQGSLNSIFKVKIKPEKGLIYFFFSRLISLVMVFGIGALLIASIVANTLLVALGSFLKNALGSEIIFMIQIGQIVLTFGLSTMLFALIFKFLPDAKIPWKNIWLGALLTAFLFMIGRHLISFYLGHINLATLYGAAGGIVILIVWINYSSWIFFLGAEVIYIYTCRKGEKITPTKNSICYKKVIDVEA